MVREQNDSSINQLNLLKQLARFSKTSVPSFPQLDKQMVDPNSQKQALLQEERTSYPARNDPGSLLTEF
jgi:hypothetical protein